MSSFSNFILPQTLVALFAVGSLSAEAPNVEKLAIEREKLVDLVLSLEEGFAQTLNDFRQLQVDYAKLAKQKTPPRDPAAIKKLQRQLDEANKKIRTLEDHSSSDSEQDTSFLRSDLVNLRNELHRERQLLLVAKAQLAKAQELEDRNQELDRELKKEAVDHAALRVKFVDLSKEKEALVSQVEKILKQKEQDQIQAKTRITQLEKAAENLSTQVQKQEAELKTLRELRMRAETSQKLVEASKIQQERLKQLLADREKELTSLREDLAAETTRALEIPVLIKARDELQKKFDDSQKNSADLQNKNKALTERQAELQAEINKVQTSITELQRQLANNREAMDKSEELRLLNQKLTDEQKSSAEALKVAQTSVQTLEEKLKSLPQLEAERESLREKISATEPMLTKAQQDLAQAQARIAATEKLEKDLAALTARFSTLEAEKTTLTQKLQESTAEITKLREAMPSQADQQKALANLEKDKATLADQLAKKDEELKKTRQELGKLGIRSTVLEKELATLKRSSITIDPVRYARGEADVTGQQERIYQQIKQALELFPEARFEIVGHTCDLGNREGNQRLSEQRAKALLDFLVEKGIPNNRLKSRGIGDAEPLVPNTSEANRQQNRRVVVEILD